MNLIQQFVNKKLNNMTSKELLKYSAEYGVSITNEQADKIVTLIQGKQINIYDDQERLQLLKQIAKVTSPATAQQINTLFQKLIK
ncbi:DUF2624 domain-containing protein [Bacillus sp. BP-3]|uniref:DUF2624 domain-containing protein n=1 Tax=Bacillus sp. BP-3 TaxID=3022773 RepID=UPI00232D9186|nr:DUF2624 domain-containing protein [Bacillus sp. BP-3]MDC2863383.1 DUF2624 domain-containing protein [Bacillus sp. BP-3]